MPFELLEAILGHLDTTTLSKAIRTALFLRNPSERRLYHRVTFRTFSWVAQKRFLKTVTEADRLAQQVVILVLERNSPISLARNAELHRCIEQAMKKLINLKHLNIYGSSAIISAHLDCAPFSLTHLVVSGDKVSYSDLDPPLTAILRAHPNLEELAVRFMPLPSDLASTLKAEQKSLTPEGGILCPKLKRFDGYDEGMRQFLPLRKIEGYATMGPGPKYINDEDLEAAWLTPALKESYRHLRALEVLRSRGRNRNHYLSTIAPYLTSLTHLHLLDDLDDLHATDHILSSLGRIPTLKSVTLTKSRPKLYAVSGRAREVAQLVCSVCLDLAEIFVEDYEEKDAAEDPGDIMYSRYTKGGVHDGFSNYSVACGHYTGWLYER